MPRSFIAELTISHSDLPLTPTVREVPEADVRVESQPLAHPESPSIFYSVRESDFSSVEGALADDHTVNDWHTVVEFTDCRIYQVYTSSDAKFTVPKITDLGVHVLSIRNAGRKWRFRLQTPDKETLGDYWRYCREEDVRFDLEKLYSSGPKAAALGETGLEARLTDRQREVARTATRMGYYEPDGAGAEEISDELGISPSTLSTHLRRAVAKVFGGMFEE